MIEINTSGIEKAVELIQHIPGAARKAQKRAISRALKGAQKDAWKKIKERYAIGRGAGKSHFTDTMRTRITDTGGVFSSKGRVNDLAYFKTKPTKVPKRRPAKGKYLWSQVVKGQGGSIAHAFLARMKSGHLGVFVRGKHGESMSSLPIRKLAGPSTPQMLGSPSVSEFIVKGIEQRLDKTMQHEVDAFLKGYRR